MVRRTFNDLSIEIPDEWTDDTIVTLVGTDSTRFQPSLVVSRDPAPEGTLAEYAQSQIPQVKRTVSKHELLDEREEQLAGQTAYVLEHRFLTPEKVTARQRQYFLRTPENVIVLSLTCAESELEAKSDLFRRVAESFEIGG